MVSKIRTSELSARFADKPLRMIGRISFEERSIVLPRALRSASALSGTAFVSTTRSPLSEKYLAEITEIHSELKIALIDIADPIASADAIFSVLKSAANDNGLNNTLIDVSSFRREELLILIAAIDSLDLRPDTNGEIVYVSADKMADDWLSRNVVAHRSVVGYAGEMRPSRHSTLVLMLGFEIDRARSIIENYEPAKVILGMGSANESISEHLYQRNKNFFNELAPQFPEINHTFEFSARDPAQTLRDLEKAIPLDESSNIILAPLNTKLSTIGAALFALKHRQVQVCYAEVDEYNEPAYSAPGKNTFIVPVSQVKKDTGHKAPARGINRRGSKAI